MRKHIYLWPIVALLALISVLAAIAPEARANTWVVPPDPVAVEVPNGTPGAIYYGAVPPGGGTGKPVLVFVQGMHGEARNWWTNTRYNGRNDMYDYAYNYGYRTAFVDLADSAGAGASMWTNGQMLAGQIETIAAHYGVGSLNVVAHSKGGLDAQTAIVHYGAGPRVQKLFTLSTPHWGSQTADLCYSTWTWWLAELLGQRDEGTYVVQTGYMRWYREITDPRPENAATRYYTGGGTSWGPFFSALWWGGSFLGFYGSNDGLVTLASSRNPLATHVFNRNLDHDSVRLGRTVFPTVDGYVSSLWRSGPVPEEDTQNAMRKTQDSMPVTSGSILRGGPIAANGAIDQITVEPGASHITLDLVSNSPGLDLRWTTPDGSTYSAAPVPDAGGYFRGGYHYVVEVDAPTPGAWRMAASNRARGPAAYLLAANLASPVQVTLDLDPALSFSPGSPLDIRVSAGDTAGRRITGLDVTTQVTVDGAARGGTFSMQGAGDALNGMVTLPQTTGVANLSITVKGRLSDGSNFERSLATSVPVVAKGAGLRK